MTDINQNVQDEKTNTAPVAAEATSTEEIKVEAPAAEVKTEEKKV